MKLRYIFLGLIAFAVVSSCKKDIGSTYTISGRLLESSSNPIPVKNYLLNLQQADDVGFFGGVLGVDNEYRTDENGNFKMRYSRGENSGFVSGGININPLSISGTDRDQYAGLYSRWYFLPPNKDTALNVMYLYKKIDRFVVKIQFNSDLAATDSLELISHTAYKSRHKLIRGPIAATTVLTADTIDQFKAEWFNCTDKTYIASFTLKQIGYHETFSEKIAWGDESYREQLLLYRR